MRTISHIRLCRCTCSLLELVCERLVVEESPWVVELVVPRPLEIMHTLKHIFELLIAY